MTKWQHFLQWLLLEVQNQQRIREGHPLAGPPEKWRDYKKRSGL